MHAAELLGQGGQSVADRVPVASGGVPAHGGLVQRLQVRDWRIASCNSPSAMAWSGSGLPPGTGEASRSRSHRPTPRHTRQPRLVAPAAESAGRCPCQQPTLTHPWRRTNRRFGSRQLQRLAALERHVTAGEISSPQTSTNHEVSTVVDNPAGARARVTPGSSAGGSQGRTTSPPRGSSCGPCERSPDFMIAHTHSQLGRRA
jgi:hypothetical protein